MVSLMMGCVTRTIEVKVPSCDGFTNMTYSSSKDTTETIDQVKVHNKVYDEFCKDKEDK